MRNCALGRFAATIAAVACFAPLAGAFSSGSPVCTVTTAEMNSNMGERLEENPNGWRLETNAVTYSPGGVTFGIRIAHATNRSFRGLLLWALDSSNTQVGTWQNIPNAFQANDECGGRSLTHRNANSKFSPSAFFQLSLPLEVRGQITLHAFVVESERAAHYETVSRHVHLDVVRNDLDIDTSRAPSRYQALTDGILVVRYLYGLRGVDLTRGAKSDTALRTDTEIEAQIEFLRSSGALDIDGDLSTLPETDGLLIVRYLLGYRGQSLVEGLNINPNNTDAIEAKISALLPQ